ncbi:AraC family transcriptional regulator [Aneurinibacillus aneurinilyticus]|uniref:AraC family transcriptional regulator n=1 Tax=Aneurinibacillus aneurinilyticus TaxID=1391 RepID=UPI0023F2F88F|nr:AraC family transcriptional regulator [Aneurinibacillus aneurinilyticus]MED0669094.1 AraC family transcriptional regulator [Aneurinibacillus aneurinilyticus]
MGQGERTVRFDHDLQIEAYRFQGIMQKFPNHFHEYYVIGFIESGQRRLSCKNKDYVIGTGDIIFFNPLDNHECEQIDNKPLDYRCLNIEPEVMQKVTKEITGKDYLPRFTNSVSYQGEQANLLHNLHQMIMDEFSYLEKEEAFYFLMEQLIEKYTEEYAETKHEGIDQEIEKVCQYLEAHYAEHVALDYLANISNMNKYSLLRSFTRIRGITPYRYLQTVRINKAKKLLEKGVKPLDAAIQTGFVDQSHFSNFFIEFIGLTPGQYRDIFINNDK